MDKRRFSIQAVSALLHNANLKGFLTGKIYQGAGKNICVPGLNCYSCPGAVGACPIGSLQGFLSGLKFRFPYYVLGFLIFFGALLGRAVCGFLCPFGFFQELLHKIPFPIKKNSFKGDRQLRWVKYAVLLLLVVVLPLCFALTPFFCKYLCPAGTLSGILLAVHDSMLRAQLGGIFLWKAFVLAAVIVGCLIVFRPFCKYLCPLGAIYGFFNRIALYRMDLDADRCVSCGKCKKVCQMGVDPVRECNSAECIRCGDCVRNCPVNAIHMGIKHGQAKKHSEKTTAL
ncbi:MAG: 4Fe-4S binding protein [Faecousia sp.]